MDFCGTQSQSVSKWFEEKLKKKIECIQVKLNNKSFWFGFDSKPLFLGYILILLLLLYKEGYFIEFLKSNCYHTDFIYWNRKHPKSK